MNYNSEQRKYVTCDVIQRPIISSNLRVSQTVQQGTITRVVENRRICLNAFAVQIRILEVRTDVLQLLFVKFLDFDVNHQSLEQEKTGATKS